MKLKLSTPKEVRKSLATVANMVLNGDIDAKKSNAFVYVCNAIISSIRIDEQQKETTYCRWNSFECVTVIWRISRHRDVD